MSNTDMPALIIRQTTKNLVFFLGHWHTKIILNKIMFGPTGTCLLSPPSR
jgi:hypothetical protein